MIDPARHRDNDSKNTIAADVLTTGELHWSFRQVFESVTHRSPVVESSWVVALPIDRRGDSSHQRRVWMPKSSPEMRGGNDVAAADAENRHTVHQ